jgi:hypothetical protein
MKFFKLTLFMSLLMTGLMFTSCGDDEEVCDGKTCPAGQTLTADCNCIDTETCPGVTCGDNEILDAETCTCVQQSNEVVVTANITSDVTWTADKIYILAGRIAVESGATLTIEPGTIVKGQAGQEANATALLVARGGTLIADGTASAPIIFTSVADEIQPGMIASPNLNPSQSGLWGGVIVLGNAPISADADAVQIEGIPPSDQNGLYGGNDPADNSGILRYVSIRHGGTDIGDGNEINGLTLGGVGTGTVISHVEVIANVDDGIEFFGGSVNASNCLVWGQGDDAFDCDQAWTGTLTNFIGIAGPDSDHSLELDGPEGSREGTFTLENGSLKGYNEDGENGGEYADLRSDVRCNISNVYFFNYSQDSDFELDNEGVSMNYTNGLITLSNMEFNVSHLSTGNLTIDAIVVDRSGLDAFTANPAGASVVTTPGTGADKAPFANWSLADNQGELADF